MDTWITSLPLPYFTDNINHTVHNSWWMTRYFFLKNTFFIKDKLPGMALQSQRFEYSFGIWNALLIWKGKMTNILFSCLKCFPQFCSQCLNTMYWERFPGCLPLMGLVIMWEPDVHSVFSAKAQGAGRVVGQTWGHPGGGAVPRHLGPSPKGFVCFCRQCGEHSDGPLGWKAERLGRRPGLLLWVPLEILHSLRRKGRPRDV